MNLKVEPLADVMRIAPAVADFEGRVARRTGIPSVSVVAVLLLGWLAMFGPTYIALAHTVWATDEQGHGPIILAVSAWLLYSKRAAIVAAATPGSRWLGVGLFVVGWCCYVVGRSQYIWMLEVGAQIVILASFLVFFGGTGSLRAAWFSLFFLLFMVPLPGDLVAVVTGPLKSAVSSVASSLLYYMGYPIGRSGVSLTIGPYQLLVADACAGLNSMFTLEALGLLYMNLMNYKSAARNIALALLIIPISFVANIVRVMILVLVTYRFGDEAGQGFVHGFAGMVLFFVALILTLAADWVLGLFFREQPKC